MVLVREVELNSFDAPEQVQQMSASYKQAVTSLWILSQLHSNPSYRAKTALYA